MAQVDDDGALHFLGRGGDVINTGGEKVHPHEVERALLRHPDVTDAVVVGVSDDTWGQRVAAVVASPNRAVTSPDIQQAVRQTLAGYKVPRTIVVRAQLPRTPTGKLEASWAHRIVTTGGGP